MTLLQAQSFSKQRLSMSSCLLRRIAIAISLLLGDAHWDELVLSFHESFPRTRISSSALGYVLFTPLSARPSQVLFSHECRR